MNKIERLTDLEIKIMKVMWEFERCMTIQEIASQLESQKISTGSVTQSVRHLLKKGAVEVEDHVLVGSVYARAFKPSYSKEVYLATEFKRMQKSIFGKIGSSFAIAAALLDNAEDSEGVNADELKQLQSYIDAKEAQIRKEDN